MRVTGTSKTCVWCWQHRCMEADVDGLLVNKTRPSRPPLDATVVERAVALTLTKPPSETTHWMPPPWLRLARSASVRCKVRDIVGLYVNPPEHAVVLSVDEKSQIQKAGPDRVAGF